ncbi:MAG: PTS sugar transporter subunit IIB [Bacillota bacterium]
MTAEMPVKHLRIDNRLIHGQVVVAWAKHEGIDTLIVANDQVAADDFQRTILVSVAPPGIRVLVLGVGDTLAYVRDPAHEHENVFILCKTPEDALALHEGGLGLQEMNVGNMAFVVGSKKVSKSVFVTPENVETFKKLSQSGVRLTCRMMPTEGKNDFMAMLRNAKALV